MGVDPDITRQIIHEELQGMIPLIASYRWEVNFDLDNPIVTVEMVSSVKQERYIIEAKCDDYKALPPYFEFLHPTNNGERGTKRCYPSDGSFFHGTPCICVEWNRKAYASHGGPHNEWQMTNWVNRRPGMSTLGDMFHLVQRLINDPSKYRGRMEQ